MAVWFKVLTHNPEVPSSSPLLAGRAGVNTLVASLPARELLLESYLFIYLFSCILFSIFRGSMAEQC